MNIPEITPEELERALAGPNPPALLDVRQSWEHALVALPGARLIPLHLLPARLEELEDLRGREVVVYCHLGVRSLTGAALLLQHGLAAKSLAGGIDAWAVRIDPELARY